MRIIAIALLSVLLLQSVSAQEAPAMPHPDRGGTEREPTMSCRDRLALTTELLDNYREQIRVLKAQLAALAEKENEHAADADAR